MVPMLLSGQPHPSCRSEYGCSGCPPVTTLPSYGVSLVAPPVYDMQQAMAGLMLVAPGNIRELAGISRQLPGGVRCGRQRTGALASAMGRVVVELRGLGPPDPCLQTEGRTSTRSISAGHRSAACTR
jgi:hypothetical protein